MRSKYVQQIAVLVLGIAVTIGFWPHLSRGDDLGRICSAVASRHGPLIASDWGQSAEVQALAKVYSEIPVVFKPRTKLDAAPGSLRLKDPELELILDDINTWMVNESEFIQRVEAIGGAIRSKRDLFAFFENRLKIFESGLNAYAKRVESAYADLARDIRMSVQEGVKEEIERLREGMEGVFSPEGKVLKDPSFTEYLEMTRRSVNWMRSKLVELHVMASQAAVKKYSLSLKSSKIVLEAIEKTKTEQKKLLGQYPGHIQHMTQKYPQLFGNALVQRRTSDRGRILKPSEHLEVVFDWILDKEIDVVMERSGQEIWFEVKMNKDPYTLVQLQKNLIVNKVYTQAIGLRQTLQFLKLEDRVKLQIWATQGFEPAAAAEMKRIGVEVVQ